MPFIWTTSPQLPLPTPPESIPSTATSYKVDVVANTVNAGGELLYNTNTRSYDVIYEFPKLNVGNLVTRSINTSFANITFLNLLSGIVRTNATSGFDIVNFFSRGGGGSASINAQPPLSYDIGTGNLSLNVSGVVASSYGSSNLIPTFVVDSFGRITSAANVGISVDLQSHPSILINPESPPTSLAVSGDPIVSGYRYSNSWVPSQKTLPTDLVSLWTNIVYNGKIAIATGIDVSGGFGGLVFTAVSEDGISWKNSIKHDLSALGATGSVVAKQLIWVPTLDKFLLYLIVNFPPLKQVLGSSSDGVHWEYKIDGYPPNIDFPVVYGQGKIVGIFQEQPRDNIYTSVDGTNWSQSSFLANTPDRLFSIGYSDDIDRFVSIGRTVSPVSTLLFHVSFDAGKTWFWGSSNTDISVSSSVPGKITYGNGLFLTSLTQPVLTEATPNIITTTTGTNWDSWYSPITSVYNTQFYNGLFVAQTTGTYIWVTDNVLFWSNVSTDKFLSDITFINSRFIGTGEGFSRAQSDATGWVDTTAKSNGKICIASDNNGNFVVVLGSGVLKSSDGKNWSQNNNSFIGDWKSIAYNGTTYTVIGRTGASQVSTTGDTWSTGGSTSGIYNDVTWNGNLFVAVGESGAVKTSPDGSTWTIRTAPSNNWNGVTSGNNITVAVGNNNAVMTSPNGITWTSRTGANANWTAVSWNGSLFAAVGNNAVMTSYDGITWTKRNNTPNGLWTNISWNGSVFAAIANNSVMTSPTGLVWTRRTNIPNSNWVDLAWSGSVFAAVGNSTNNIIMSTEPMEVTSVAGRTGTIELNTFDVLENVGGPFYHTTQRVRGNVSNSDPITYDPGTGVFGHGNTSVSQGTYGNASHISVVSVDFRGHTTNIQNIAISISTSQITSGILSVARGGTGKDSTGLVNGQILIGNTVNTGFDLATITQTHPIIVTSGMGSIRVSHAASGVIPGVYGNAVRVPAITVDSNGHITNISNVSISVPALMPTGNGTTGDRVFYENDQIVTGNYTITSGRSAMTAGPVTINPSIVVTVPSGSKWVVL